VLKAYLSDLQYYLPGGFQRNRVSKVGCMQLVQDSQMGTILEDDNKISCSINTENCLTG
jgi:hypothetical protein